MQSHVPFAHNGVAYKRCARPPRCLAYCLLSSFSCANTESVLMPTLQANKIYTLLVATYLKTFTMQGKPVGQSLQYHKHQ